MIRALEILGDVERDWQAITPVRRRRAILTPPADRSPYFTPPRTGPVTRSRAGTVTVARDGAIQSASKSSMARLLSPGSPCSAVSRRSRAKAGRPALGKKKAKAAIKAGGKPTKRVMDANPPKPLKDSKAPKRTKKSKGHDMLTTDDTMNAVLAVSETGVVEPIGKIHLIQERVRHDPWKMLIATCLLNKTSGRAARPIFIQLLDRWPTAQALSEDLTELLYPLGLFNQRASSLIRFSQQYTTLKWPIHPGTTSSNPLIHPTTAYTPIRPLPDKLDVTVFHGSGRYASDSFRIYSDLFPGRGGPENESRLLVKREKAIGLCSLARDASTAEKIAKQVKEEAEEPKQAVNDPISQENGIQTQGWDVEELGGYLSDEEDSGEEEWRRVRPLDKELRRYLIWRWGLEGIVYDIHAGPQIKRDRDLRRLRYLLDPESASASE